MFAARKKVSDLSFVKLPAAASFLYIIDNSTALTTTTVKYLKRIVENSFYAAAELKFRYPFIKISIPPSNTASTLPVSLLVL